MKTRIWFQWKIRTLLILTALVSLVVAWGTHKYRQHYSVVSRVSESGGKVNYAHQRPEISVSQFLLSRSRQKEIDGELRAVVANAYIPVFSIQTDERNERNLAPKPGVFYQAMRYLSGNTSGKEKAWSLFDFENDWTVVHIDLPIAAFDDRMIDYLLSLPDLEYVTVSGMVDVTPKDESYGTPSPDPGELERLRQINGLLPSVQVVSFFKQWLKDENDLIIYH